MHKLANVKPTTIGPAISRGGRRLPRLRAAGRRSRHEKGRRKEGQKGQEEGQRPWSCGRSSRRRTQRPQSLIMQLWNPLFFFLFSFFSSSAFSWWWWLGEKHKQAKVIPAMPTRKERKTSSFGRGIDDMIDGRWKRIDVFHFLINMLYVRVSGWLVGFFFESWRFQHRMGVSTW